MEEDRSKEEDSEGVKGNRGGREVEEEAKDGGR